MGLILIHRLDGGEGGWENFGCVKINLSDDAISPLPFPSPHWQSIFSFYAFSNDVACSVCIFENGKFNY